MNWLIFGLAFGVALLLDLLLIRVGAIAWWRRKAALLQLVLMLILPLLLALVILPALWLFHVQLTMSISIFSGFVAGVLLLFVGYSFLIQQIWLAFSDSEASDDPPS